MIRARRSHIWTLGLLLLAAVGIVALVGLQSTPLFDRDEPRYAQASKQMFETGDWVVPMLLDEPRLKKPIAIYWAQAGTMHLLGPTVQSARLPSAIALILTSALLLVAVRSIIGARRTLWATFIFATSLLVLFAGKTTLTDSLLLLWITAAQLCLYAVWRGRYDTWLLIAMGLCLGLAMLTKGPVVLMFMGMTLVALHLLQIKRINPRAVEQGRRIAISPEQALPRAIMRIALVVGCALLMLAPWIILLERQIPGAIVNMLGSEVVARGTEPQEGHAGPPGYYLLTLPATWFPWIILLPATCVHAWRRRHRPMTRFAIAAVLGPWIFL
ncbi:MAG TPA: phospholipid carrier-dependent glycosyltransferase, partial [Tepidisphaeraceae bacterium]|nr:phospholipid carrier-dependent glycosyltransferase [Tepidisphaeraceae bacterium]